MERLQGFFTTSAGYLIGELKREIEEDEYCMSEVDSCLLLRAAMVSDFPDTRLKEEDCVIQGLVSRFRAAGISEYGRKDAILRFLFGVPEGNDMAHLKALARKL